MIKNTQKTVSRTARLLTEILAAAIKTMTLETL